MPPLHRLAWPVAAALVATAALADDGSPSWAYDGPAGPAAWGDLSSAYAACATGAQQSPIDLSGAVGADITPPRLEWSPASARVVNTGATIQVDLTGAGGVWHGETPFRLTHIQFRHASEHALDGRRYPLEVQFVHTAQNGAMATIGVMVDEGPLNPALDAIWAAASPVPAPGVELPGGFDPRALLPEDTEAVHYAGSLTAPPCSEVVTWTVMTTPITASAEQIAAFANAFPNNARPLQPRNRRFVLRSP